MKSYEIVREIFNQCSNNQMRDVTIEEKAVEDPAAYVRDFCQGKEFTLDRDDRPDGTVIFNLEIAGLRQRFSFTPLD